MKSAVERAQFGKAETDFPSAQGLDVVIVGTGDMASDCVALPLCARAAARSPSWYAVNGGLLNSRGLLPLAYAHEEALGSFRLRPRRFGVQVKELVTGSKGELSGLVTSDGDTVR
ncbi:MAG: hypothetical protein V8T45_06560 [Oscillospiraceae bacterium]